MFSLNEGGLLVYLFRNGVPSRGLYYFSYISFLLIVIAAAYLLGSLNSSIVVSRVLYHDDIRKHGSGNAGLTNTLRTYGLKAAGLTLLGDMLKTALGILVAGFLFGFWYRTGISTGDGMCYVAGLFSVLGHIFPIWYKFKGGKGVLATATMALILAPVPFLILFALFVAIVWMSKYVSLGSVCAAMLFPVTVHSYFLLVLGGRPLGLVSLSTVLLAIIVVWCHRGNLKRISERTERKLSFKKKTEAEKPVAEEQKKQGENTDPSVNSDGASSDGN